MSNYNLGTARGRIEIDSSGAEAGAKKSEKAVGRITGALGGIGGAAATAGVGVAAGGAAVAAGFGYAINAAANFEQRMSAVQAVSGATGSEMKSLSDLALRLGADTSFSASEAATAIEELVKAGISVPDVMNGAADATVALAAAGEIELPRAAEIASNAMNQFGLTAKEMPKVADLIAGAANASAIDVGDLGMAMSQAGAVANLAGLSFEDTAIAIAEMGNAGIKGSDAGTSLKTMLSNLQPTTKAQISAMRDLGLITESGSNAFYDAQGNLKGLADIQEILSKATKGLTSQQKTMALETIFGSDAIRAAAVLSKEGAAGYNEMSKAMNGMTAADVAATRLDNFKGSVEQLKGSAETAAIVFGQQFLGALRVLVDGLTSLLNTITTNIGPAMDTLKLFFAVLQGKEIKSSLPWAKTVIDIGNKVKPVFAALVQGFKNIWAFVSGPMRQVATVLLQVFGPLIAGAVGALILAFGKVTEVLRPLGELLVKIAGFVKDNATVFQALAVAVTAGVLAWKAYTTVVTLMGLAQKAITATAVAVRVLSAAMLANPIGIIIALVAALVAGILYLWNTNEGFRNIVISVWNAIKAAVLAVANWFTGTLVPWLQGAWEVIKAGLAPILAVFSTIWNAIKVAVEFVVNFLIAIVSTWFNIWRTVIGTGLNFIGALFSRIWNGISGVVSGVWNVLKTVVSTGINFYKNVITAGLNIIKSVFTTVWNAIKGVVSTVMNGIRTVISAAIGIIKGIFTGDFGAVTGIVKGIMDKVKNAISGVWDNIKRLFTDNIDKIKGFFSGAGTWLIQAGKNIIQGLIDGIKNMIGNLKGLLDNVTGWIPDWKGPEKRDKILLEHNGEVIMGGLIRGVESMIRPLSNTFASITKSIPSTVQASITSTPALALPQSSMTRSEGPITIQVHTNIDTLTDLESFLKFVATARQQARQRQGV